MSNLNFSTYRINKITQRMEWTGDTLTLRKANQIAQEHHNDGYDGCILFKSNLGWIKEKEFFANEEF